jgi:4'-phosphopantetheinyl transferase
MKTVARWPEETGARIQPPAPGEVHLWRADIDGPAKGLEIFPGPLSTPERERALRFKFADHRRRYVHARSWLRKILGSYLQLEPQAVPVCISENGKPYLESGAGWADLRFNLSHSAGFGLLAVATGAEVGVDVQIESAKNDWPAIAERYFTVKEFGHIRALPPAAQAAACVEIWTRKEAAGKALGIGLHSKTFSFAVGPAAWGKVRCDENLTVWSLAVEAPFAAAVAIQG